MRKQVSVVIVGTIMSFLFAVMFWLQLGAIATSTVVAQPKAGAMHTVAPNPYLPFQSLEPVY